MSTLAVFLYRVDKRAAQLGQWRISEVTLHLTDLLGGLPGGLVAQQVLRHKTSKRSFATVTWSILMFHTLVMLALIVGIDFGSLMSQLGSLRENHYGAMPQLPEVTRY